MKKKKSKEEFCFSLWGEFTKTEFILASKIIGMQDLTPHQFRSFITAYMDFQNKHILPEILRRELPGLGIEGKEMLKEMIGDEHDTSMH